MNCKFVFHNERVGNYSCKAKNNENGVIKTEESIFAQTNLQFFPKLEITLHKTAKPMSASIAYCFAVQQIQIHDE